MAKRKTKTVKKTEPDYLISPERKVTILGVGLALVSVFVFISILSYSPYDDFIADYGFFDLFKVFANNPEFNNKVVAIQNWMGIFGAYSSYFFIYKTIGYFSVIFPVIAFIWGWEILGKKNYALALKSTNFLLAIGILSASLLGVLRAAPDIRLWEENARLTGAMGFFFGKGIALLFGGLGGIIILSVALVLTVVFTFNISFAPLKKFFLELFNEEEDEETVSKIKKEEKETRERLAKIKKLGKSTKKDIKRKEAEQGLKTPEDFNTLESSAEDTQIRIVRKDEEETVTDESVIENPFPLPSDKSESSERVVKVMPEEDMPVDIPAEEKLPEQWEENIDFVAPHIGLLEKHEGEVIEIPEEELKRNAELLKEKLKLFDIQIEDISVTPGPVVTLYEIVPAPGVKISRIVNLEHDIALALAARGIRIIAPIPGKSAIGVEIPNAKAALVTARSVLAKVKEAKAELPMALGKTISGDVYVADLATMPHLLIAGSTGSGKSVGINMIINSLIFTKHPSDLKFVIVDPKKIELSFYKRLRKHFLAVSPDIDEEIITDPQNALIALKALEIEMEKRYDALAKAGVRDILAYNKKVENPATKPKDTEQIKHHKLPYIVVIIDELADLMLTSGKEVETPIARLAQLARAVGIHLIVATQRPSVNVITGLIKANFSARMAFKVSSKIDSRTILDMNGAEQLLGRGDMLFLPVGVPKPIRIQTAFISTEEVEKITDFVYVQKGFSKRYLLPSLVEKQSASGGAKLSDFDPMFEEAARVVVRHQQGSVSLLQRRLKLGYARAARIMDQLEQAGIVGASEGSKAREVFVESEEELETVLRSL